MKKVLIGHRGVGKTSLLKRHATLFSKISHFDLDQEIETRHQIKITDFFKNKTEAEFRELEIKTYQQIVSENANYVIALGAGFSIEKIDSQDEVIFVTRATDADGRVFLNRPRLDAKLNALAESVQRFHLRDSQYRGRADFIYHMPEGVEYSNQIEEKILQKQFVIQNAYYTLNKADLKNISQVLQNYIQIELRTDLIEKKEIHKLTQQYPNHEWLISIRDAEKFDFSRNLKIDCDIQFISAPFDNYSIVSTHTDQLEKALIEVKPFEKKFHIKLCPLIETFEELKQGHEWQALDPDHRSFLPRSQNAKWNWYRLICKFKQKLNFIRGFNDQSDQPSLFQWLSLPIQMNTWGCVLGQPVHFSRSPLVHHKFFQNKKSFFTAIHISVDEFKNNLLWLHKLGLNQAAVTAPLKEIAYQTCTEHTAQAQELKSVNTLFLLNQKISGHNTDLAGFQFLVKKNLAFKESQTVVWGGGGTLPVLRKVLPAAYFYSSQTARPRDEKEVSEIQFETLVWAAPRKEKTLYPPLNWKIKKVIDLNYTETSMGLEYAQQLLDLDATVQYVSGLEMFQEQALKQQEFWSQK